MNGSTRRNETFEGPLYLIFFFFDNPGGLVRSESHDRRRARKTSIRVS